MANFEIKKLIKEYTKTVLKKLHQNMKRRKKIKKKKKKKTDITCKIRINKKMKKWKKVKCGKQFERCYGFLLKTG